MKSAVSILILLCIPVFTITAQTQSKYNLSKKFTSEEKQRVDHSSITYQHPSSTFITTLDSCPVGEATDPNPYNGATDVSIDLPQISWVNGTGATSIEVFFDGANVYSGSPVTSWSLPSLDYATTYFWKVNSSNDSCTTFGQPWSFTTMQEPQLWYDTIHVYPQSIAYWTGTTDGTIKTDDSEVRGFDSEDGWFVFDISSVPDVSYIQQITFYGYVNATNWPYWSATPLPGINPLTASATELKTVIEANSGDGTAYVYSNEGSGFVPGAYSYEMESWANADLEAALTQQDWFAVGMDSRDNSATYFINWDGWNQTHKPYLVIKYDYCLSCINAPSYLTAVAQYENGSSVFLSWVDNSFIETFHIERKLGNIGSSNEYSEIATVDTNVTSYIDFTVNDTTMYTYRVRARAPWGIYSYYSNQAEVMTLIPVELTSFEVNIVDGYVNLNWSTATETNNLGFNIVRRKTIDVKQDVIWKKIGFVQGHGTTTEVQSYSFMDESTLSGTYQYRLKQIDYDGSFEYSNIIEVEVGIPTEFSLEQNYPNPFNPVTKIKYSISAAVGTEYTLSLLVVYDILGNEIITLVNEEKPAGIYEVEFNAAGITSGIYFYQLKAGTYTATKKMIILK